MSTASAAFNAAKYVAVPGRDGLFFATKDVVRVRKGSVGALSASIDMIDKVNAPFRLRNGNWVATGVVERTIEGNYVGGDHGLGASTGVHNAVVFGSASVDAVVAVVWPMPVKHKNMLQ